MPRGNLSVPSERKPAVTDSRFKSSSRLEFELDKGDHFLRIEFVRIVLDTCVLVAAARSLEGASNRILRSLPIDGIEPCLSVALYAEWQEVLCRLENLQGTQTLADAQAFLCFLASICFHQDVHFLWRPFLKDPDDDFILELAFAAGARYIVTHNTKDFAGSDQLGILAITPGDFYRLVFHKP